MTQDAYKPMIVQSDRSILLETDNPAFEDARDALSVFAELLKSPEHIHTYRVTPLSLWNAAASGMKASAIIENLRRFSKYEVPQNVIADVEDNIARYGQLKLFKDEKGRLILESQNTLLITELLNQRSLQPFITGSPDRTRIFVKPEDRGNVKCALIKLGFPVEDLAGYVAGSPLELALRERALGGYPFSLRRYQIESVEAFHMRGSNYGGSGVVVLPCGAGKTIVGIGVIHALQTHTLILTTNTVALRQWRNELLDKTTLTADQIGEYSGDLKEIKPVTIATYQILTYRKAKDSPFVHFGLFDEGNWGLIIYDEVHLLPAPVFRATATLQARRRLGLTATLVREDAREDDVFSLIGPKKYDVPWKVLEKQGWIAQAVCTELRVRLPEEERFRYAIANKRDKFRIASTNPVKEALCEELIERHRDDNVLVIGQYLDQLKLLTKRFKAPLITGRTSTKERERLYGAFRNGEIKLLIVSKVANFAIDLPDANVAIQVSGTFGSRQEEAQRLGRILRPKANGSVARFYSLVSKDTCDQDYSVKRQLFLTEQGYRYEIMNAEAY
ncbi:MAG TPA: helicase-associated domain-containing protein [Candidatus Hydrogenedentes bacterium]|nr:helicase-associated domain-containing protein [Candidatus Hydrogenedentota bacterium]HRT20865.1 helicase-associated domain-containing protein [Candidatus Hydrogenedentota bacterium]HRT66826.1 helicase-associated domain-containing protein [Candidatus Hydrogenedentota bacterium]